MSGESRPTSGGAPEANSTSGAGNAVIVGFHSIGESIGALRWAIDHCRSNGHPLVVVHASQVPIAVENGPSAAIAHRLGNPTWATVHTVVTGHDAPVDTVTKVRSGDIVELIDHEAVDAGLIVLGPKRRRLFRRHDTQQQLLDRLSVPVIRIDDEAASPPLDALIIERSDMVSA